MKKWILTAIFLLIVACIWAIFKEPQVSIIINDKVLSDAHTAGAGGWNLVLAFVTLCSIIILLSLILAGIGLIFLGLSLFFLLFFSLFMYPFLLPIFIPLFIIWIFCTFLSIQKKNKNDAKK